MSIEQAGYVAVIKQSGHNTTQKFRLSPDKPVVIGRSWQSDIVINDEFMDPEHLKLSVDQDGVLVVQDLNTRNGTRAGKQALQNPTQYDKGSELYIGDSAVSVFDVGTTVAPALKRDTVQRLSGKYQTVLWFLVSSIAAIAALLISALLMDATELNGETFASTLAQAGLTAAAIALVGGVLSKLFRRNTLFGLHYMFFCWMFVLFTGITIVWDIIAFNLKPGLLTNILDGTVYGVFTLLVFYGVVSMITRTSRVQKLTVSAMVVLIPIGFSYVESTLESEYDAWSSYVSFDSVDQAPMFQFRAASTIDAHLEETDKLFAKLIKEVHSGTNEFDEPAPLKNKPNSALQISEHE